MAYSREDTLQRDAFDTVRLGLPNDVLVFSIPNERLPTKNVAINAAYTNKLKSMGLYTGMADWCVVYRGQAHFIEFKCEKDLRGKRTYQRKEQKDAQAHIERAGGLYAVCRSVGEVAGTLRGWGIPVKARVAA